MKLIVGNPFCNTDTLLGTVPRDDAVRLWAGKLNGFSLLFEAMSMRETFQQIYQAKKMHDFKQLLTQWNHWVSTCKLASMVETAKTIQRHWQGVLAWKLSSINNGILEDLNSIIQQKEKQGVTVKNILRRLLICSVGSWSCTGLIRFYPLDFNKSQ